MSAECNNVCGRGSDHCYIELAVVEAGSSLTDSAQPVT